MTTVYALNLFDLAPGDDYRAYVRHSAEATAAHGGRVVAVGRLEAAVSGDADPREVMVLVEWPSRAAFDSFLAHSRGDGIDALRERGTQRYLWWLYERLEDLTPLFPGLAADVEALVEAADGQERTPARPRGRLQAKLAERSRRG